MNPPDADGISLSRSACIADVDIVVTGGEVETGQNTQSEVLEPVVLLKSAQTSGRVFLAGCVVLEGGNTVGRVGLAKLGRVP